MGQRQNHRGKHPEDVSLFSPKWDPVLRHAVADLSYLRSRGYASSSALKVVGDRYQLDVRQRRAVERAACSDASLAYRHAHRIPIDAAAQQPAGIDGYNLLITVESALSRGVLLRGRDGCVRDMASIHGSYHTVEETLPAARWIGEILERAGIARATWYFDAPVSNSARLKSLLAREAEARAWNWQIELENNPDRLLAASSDVVITSDSWILDRAARSVNLMDCVLEALECKGDVIELGAEG